MGVQQSLAKNDKEFQMEKLRIQMEHENQMTDRKIAGDKENTAAQIAAQGMEARKTQRLKGSQDEELAETERQFKSAEAEKARANEMALAAARAGWAKQGTDADREELARHHRVQEKIDASRAAHERRPNVFQIGDGRFAVYTPGKKEAEFLIGPDGKELTGPKDLPASKLELAKTSLAELMTESREYMKGFHSPEEERAHAQEMRVRFNMIKEFLDGKGELKHEPAPYNRGPYSNYKDVSPTPSVRNVPKETAPLSKTKPSGLVEDLKKTPSWMDLLSPNRK